MYSLKFEHVEYFIEVCRSNSITKAAEHIFISQQALSRSIQRLEKELGCELFQRTSAGVRLTEAGLRLYETFYPIVRSYKEAVLKTESSFGRHHARTLSFSVAPGINRSLSPELFLTFCEVYPGLKLNAIELLDKQNEQYILEDKRRFGLMIAPEWFHREKHGYVQIKTEPAHLMVHKSNPLAKKSSVSLAVLENENVLTHCKNSHFREALNKAVAPFNFTVASHFESIDTMALFDMANRGTGVMICLRQEYEKLAPENCVLIPIIERTFDYCMAFIFQEYSALDSLAQEFIRFIKNTVE